MSDFEQARVIALSLLAIGSTSDEGEVRRAAQNAVGAVVLQSPDATIDVEALIRELEANVTVLIEDAAVLVDEDGDHRPWLPDQRASVDWRFTRRYQRLLKEQKRWALPTLHQSDDLTDKILGLLEAPDRPGRWDRRGMVVGEVQSGKTSNYIELICKAADAGYKFIVVLTGTTNSLRAQAQLRFDEGFLGWDTRLDRELGSANKRVGVGKLLGEPPHRAISATSAAETGDFSRRVANQFNVRLGGDPMIMVVKKNSSVLRNLIRWAGALSLDGPERSIANIPTVVIDDEADFASVNTKPVVDDEEDPTVINGLIRQLLNSFEKSAYVGYTATPFANIFIHHDQSTAEYGADLFPRDFLINLPVPSNHVGPTKVFGLSAAPDEDGEDVQPLPLVRLVSDHEDQIPNLHKSDWHIDRLPNSLKHALRAFILACATRAARDDQGKHNSMLVHVTRFVNVQEQVADLVKAELRGLQDRIRYGDGDSSARIMDDLRAIWLEDFVPTSESVRHLYPELASGCHEVSWSDIQTQLVESSQKIQVRVINGAAKDALDYWDQPDGLSAIAIGGDKLSRGLTLEGLSVSYYLRASRMYDTLLQMGRWFGYRPGYVDLCRLYTTDELSEFYRHITMATAELRQEFDLMSATGMTPSDFGLRVRSHPAGLVITAANKMRSGIPMTVSYSADISETISFEKQANRANHALLDQFLASLGPPGGQRRRSRVWKGVAGATVADLLEELKVHPGSRKMRGAYLSSYIRAQNAEGGLTDWAVALISHHSGDDLSELGGWKVYPVRRASYPADRPNHEFEYRIGRLLNPSDEHIDLTDEQYQRALDLTMQQYKAQGTRHRNPPSEPSGPNIRRTRSSKCGLLLVYPLQEPDLDGNPLVGFAASFPKAESDTPVEYLVNSVYWEEELGL
ncbi:MAG: Z1 domain-containing protein [Chloroflexota bacterium]|nr:Z1 domain-containing protein [Chloroflexota bacterium]